MRTAGALFLVLLLLLPAGCAEERAPVAQPTVATEVSRQSPSTTGDRVRALGTIRPAQQLKLSFLVGGPIQASRLQIGNKVRAGELLAVLEPADLQFAVQEAADALAVKQGLLHQAQAGPQAEAVAVAEAELQRAQTQYEQSQASYRRALTRTQPAQIAIAEAYYKAALGRYHQLQTDPSPDEVALAQAQVDKAAVALQRAQAEYDRVAGRPDVGASPAAAALQEATIDYELAVARCDRLRRPPTPAELSEAQAQVARASAELRLAQIEPSNAEVEASAGSVAIARAHLDLARAGPRPEDVAVVEAHVQQARTALARTELALGRAELRAPFDGTVSAVYLQVGEWAAPGAPVAELLDTSGWLVVTRNVGELTIGRVQVGQEAAVRIIAFHDQELRGRVIAISPVAVVQQGDTTYTVLIELEDTDLNLHSGMNAEVEILTE